MENFLRCSRSGNVCDEKYSFSYEERKERKRRSICQSLILSGMALAFFDRYPFLMVWTCVVRARTNNAVICALFIHVCSPTC
ncbi:hypothetical protein F2K65_19775 [Vibrio parahaemolyticus]|nr:hypothetical protein D0871_08935 [Vibrio parahaemolyticus]EGQ9445066.1 hypothetical protein [Vibrio parahaemolyticus]